jgi:integrase
VKKRPNSVLFSISASPRITLANRLTNSQVDSLRYGVPDKAGNDKEWRNDGNGLYIRVRPNGSKSWVLRRKIFNPDKQASATRKTTLVRYSPGHPAHLSLKDARLRAAQLRTKDVELAKKVPSGKNRPGTFGQLLSQYYDEQIEPRYKRPRQVQMYIDNRVPEFVKALTITDLDNDTTRDFRIIVRHWLFSYAQSSGPLGANRLSSILKQATKYGAAIGYIAVDPLRDLTRNLVGGSERPCERTLTDDKIKRLWRTESPHIPLLKFLLLTGQRIGEAQLANWSDLQDGRWIIPSEHSKNRKPQWVPITEPIQWILDSLPRNRSKIFAARSTTGTQSWLKRWCQRENINPRFTPHDLRRTFVTGLNELGVAPYVVEKLVNHSMSGVMAIYNKAEYSAERIEAADLWGRHITKIANE